MVECHIKDQIDVCIFHNFEREMLFRSILKTTDDKTLSINDKANESPNTCSNHSHAIL